MGAIDVGVECGKLVLKRIADKTLCGQMVALVGLHLEKHLEDAGETLQRGRVKAKISQDVANPPHPVAGIFKGHPAHDAVDLISFFKEKFSKVRTILAGDAGDQCFLHVSGSGEG